MVKEFLRYDLVKMRVPTGLLQISLSLLMLYGLYDHSFIFPSSLLFVIMMSGALFVRVKIRDTFKSSLPALLYLFVNLYISYNSLV
jgi:hypothetical protein